MSSSNGSAPSAMQFTAAWLLFILLLFFLARTKYGGVLLYYLAWSACFLLIVVHYQEITSLFKGVVTP